MMTGLAAAPTFCAFMGPLAVISAFIVIFPATIPPTVHTVTAETGIRHGRSARLAKLGRTASRAAWLSGKSRPGFPCFGAESAQFQAFAPMAEPTDIGHPCVGDILVFDRNSPHPGRGLNAITEHANRIAHRDNRRGTGGHPVVPGPLNAIDGPRPGIANGIVIINITDAAIDID